MSIGTKFSNFSFFGYSDEQGMKEFVLLRTKNIHFNALKILFVE
jgi:hypothetical protein